jgi:lysophospholipase L1-like esterase
MIPVAGTVGFILNYLMTAAMILIQRLLPKLIPVALLTRALPADKMLRFHCPIYLLLLGLHPGTSLQGAPHFWDEIPLSPSTALPAAVNDDYWNGQWLRINREVLAAENSQLVFFGDSITWSWSLGPATGKELWEKRFAPCHPVNMGNSGDITPVMLYRLARGNLDFARGKHPRVAVLLCGINNLIVSQSDGGREKWDLGPGCPPEDIAHGQRAIAQFFRRKLPQTRVIMMSLLPVADAARWEKCQRVNSIQSDYVRNENEVVLLNLQDRFFQPDGRIQRALFTDGIHLSKEGYQTWADGIAPVLEKFMNAPPPAPAKIMLIGGAAVEGMDSSRSYRRYLDGMLRREGHLIDFVGSRRRHNNDAAEPDSYQFDPDHEGHGNRDTAWLAENLPVLPDNDVPDIAVIHPDAEDLPGNPADAGIRSDEIARQLDRLIGVLYARNKAVMIVVAEAIPVKGREEMAKLLNHRISQRALQSTAPAVNVSRLAPDFQSTGDLEADGRTLTIAGAKKTAANLSGVISPVLSRRRLEAP